MFGTYTKDLKAYPHEVFGGSNTDVHKAFDRSGLFHSLNGTGVFAIAFISKLPKCRQMDHTVYECSEYYFLQSLAWRIIPVSTCLINIVGKSLK